jgi:hypothetical protein
MWYVSDVRLGLRQNLVLGGLAIVVVVSFAFTLLQLALTRKTRAVFFAREATASIGDRRELQSGARRERRGRERERPRARSTAWAPRWRTAAGESS